MTFIDALTDLRGFLPANPELDDPHQAAVRVLVGVYPVTWRDEGQERNAWSRNRFTGEIEPDPVGDPLYTTTPPGDPE